MTTPSPWTRVRPAWALLAWAWFLGFHLLYAAEAARVTAERVPALAWMGRLAP